MLEESRMRIFYFVHPYCHGNPIRVHTDKIENSQNEFSNFPSSKIIITKKKEIVLIIALFI